MTDPADTPTAAPGYELSDDPARLDRDAVWRFLHEDAYWSKWRDRAVFDGQLAVSWRVVGAYQRSTGAQVGFARAISDGFSMAYLADVFVLPEHRGHGLGHALVSTMIDDGPGARFRWMLHTADAQGLYMSHGFGEPSMPYLERAARLD
ncbi:MAG TPA: GNAT family N-acetyltransferase [Cellulomonas sp.]